MTGFARADGTENGYRWTWEIRSVNARAMDARLRVPPGMERLEVRLKPAVDARFHRGNISATLALVRPLRHTSITVNQDVLEQVVALARDVAGRVEAAPPRVDGLLGIRGVLEAVEEEESEEDRARLDDAVVASFEAGLGRLAENRAREGARLAAVVAGHLDEIAGLAARAGDASAVSALSLEQRLREQVRALLKDDPVVPEDRLVQEVAMLLVKGDVREELDRLRAHVEAAQELLGSDEPIGRRFDFLCQEFNREANTLCSKADDLALTNLGIELKAAIEQLREQAQNIE